MKKTFVILFLLSLGCARIQIVRMDEATPAKTPVQYVSESFFLGFMPYGTPPSPCAQSQVETVRMRKSPGQVLLAMATLGIYVTQNVEITCR